MKFFGIIGSTALLACMLCFGGCGGGAGTETGTGQQQAATATIVFSVTSTARLPIRLNNMQITMNLPSEVTCTANPVGRTNIWDLFGGTANYSVSPKQITFAVIDAGQSQAGSQMGEFARLTCSVNAGSSVTTASFTGINTPVPSFKATGYDGANSVDLYDPANQYSKRYVTPSLAVTVQ